MQETELFRLAMIYRVFASIWPFVPRKSKHLLLDTKPSSLMDLSAEQFENFRTELAKHQVPAKLLSKLSRLYNKDPMPEFSLLEDWETLCGSTRRSGEVQLPMGPGLRPEFEYVSVVRYTCENNKDLGEIHYQVNDRDLVFKTFNLEQDWAAIVDKNKPKHTFSLSDIVRTFVSEPSPTATACIGDLLMRTPCAALVASTKDEFASVQQHTQTAQRMCEAAQRTLPASLVAQVQRLVGAHSASPTQLAIVGKDIAELEQIVKTKECACAQKTDLVVSDEVRNLAANIFRELGHFRGLGLANGPIWLQMLSELGRCNTATNDDQAKALNRLSLLASQLKAVVPAPINNSDILVPLCKKDFFTVFQECAQVFLMCESSMGHAPLKGARCIKLATPDSARVVKCLKHGTDPSLEFVLSNTSLLIQSLMQSADSEFDDIRASLKSITLAAEARQPVGYFPVFVPVNEIRPGEELLSTPDERGFVAVKRAVLPPQAVIALELETHTLVIQDL